MKSAPAIAFDYRPSHALQAVVAAVGMFALLAVAVCGMPAWAKLAAAAAGGAGLVFSLRRLRAPLLRRCAWHGNGEWRVRDASGEDHAAELLRATVRGAAIVLLLRSPLQKSMTLLLLPDNCDADTRRRLRVRLARTRPGATADA